MSTPDHHLPGRSRKPTGGSPATPATDFDRLGSLLEQVLDQVERGTVKRAPAGPRVAAGSGPTAGPEVDGQDQDFGRRIAGIWDQIVGPEIRANARPIRFHQGRLAVAASSSAWAQSLQLMSEQIREALNRALGADAVFSITFRHAGWEAQRR